MSEMFYGVFNTVKEETGVKIGIIGPQTTATVIQQVVEKEFPEIQLVFRCSEFYEESAAIAEVFQNEREVGGPAVHRSHQLCLRPETAGSHHSVKLSAAQPHLRVSGSV